MSEDNPKFMQNTQLQIWLYGLRVKKPDTAETLFIELWYFETNKNEVDRDLFI